MTNVDKLRHAYQTWFDTRGTSPDVWLDVLAPDVVLRSLAGGHAAMKFSTTRHGLAEAKDYFNELRSNGKCWSSTRKNSSPKGIASSWSAAAPGGSAPRAKRPNRPSPMSGDSTTAWPLSSSSSTTPPAPLPRAYMTDRAR